MDSKLQRYCDGILEAGWLAAVVITPLFFNIHSSRVFEPDKLTLLRSIALLMAAVWLVKFIDRQGWRSLAWLGWRSEDSIWRMPFVLPVFLLAIVYLLSSAVSITPVVSWAGSYQRLQGTYTTLSYIVIFALMLATIRDRAQVARVVTTVIVTSIPVALYGMLQHFDLDPLPWGGDTQVRIAGSMGNSIFIAAYLIMVVPLTLARIIDSFTNILTDDELNMADVIRSSIYIFALAIQIIAIWWSGSRGPFVGIAAGIYAFVLILLVTLRNAQADERVLRGTDVGKSLALVLGGTLLPLVIGAVFLSDRVSDLATFGFFIGSVIVLVGLILVLALAGRAWRWLWLGWILLALTLGGFFALFNVGTALAETYTDTPVVSDTLSEVSSWRDLPEIGRYGRLLEAGARSGRVRVLIWEGALDLLNVHEPLERPDGQADPFNFLRPVLGYGPESMYVAYNRFYPPELATIEARNASPDRAHNETFDAVVITGAAGLLVWQFLYLSVFYYGFRWLGVVKSNRDRNVLIGLWIGGAILGGVVLTAMMGMPFIGVAIPFGAIFGLVLYLVYYAASSRSDAANAGVNPFGVDRLIMIGLVSAMLAHYAEIHFGIAIASTRTHFFVYLALMFMIGFLLPRLKQAPEPEPTQGKKRKKARRQAAAITEDSGWISPVLGATFVLALIIGILAYDFMTFSLPPGETLASLEVSDIFRQSFFVNSQRDFQELPFIYLLLILSWVLGALLFLSELSKRGVIGFKGVASATLDRGSRRGAYFLLMTALLSAGSAVLSYFMGEQETTVLLERLGFWLLLIYAALCLWAGLRMLQLGAAGRQAAGAVAVIGVVFALPGLAAGGGLYAAIIGLTAAVALYLLWDGKNWGDLYTPALVVTLLSFSIGLSYAYLHGLMVRNNFRRPDGVTEETLATVQRVLEADQSAAILTGFYVFLFALLLLSGVALAWERMGKVKAWATAVGMAAMVILLPLAFYAIGQTNLQVVQADIVYKRADPYDKEAGRSGNPELWDSAIAIYEHAIDLAPGEDFYYLWLGRAYLERSSVTEDQAEQDILLRRAEERLIEAQGINPLNTDHTANLARLNTRWAELAADQERQERVEIASNYYDAAMSLSPNNAIIINEYARLAYALDADCDKAITLLERSTERDPFFADTLFEQARILQVCSQQQSEEAERLQFLEKAAESYSEALERQPGKAQDWLQLAGLYITLGQVDEALLAYDEASAVGGDDLEQWRIDYTLADWFFQEGEFGRAQEFGKRAFEGAPAEVADQIQQFIDRAAAAGGQVDG